ncbi:MAG: BACON domain-containing protein [Alistipes sp.]
MKKSLLSALQLLGAIFLWGCGDTDELPVAPDHTVRISVPQTLTLRQEGGWATLSVACDGEWEAQTDADWLDLKPQRGYGDGEVTVTARACEEVWGREASIRFRGGAAEASTLVVQPSLAPVRVDADGAANCYLLAPDRKGTVYAFDATRMGNSAEPTAVAGVRIVWQSRPELLHRIAYDPKSGLIGVTTGSEAGNAVVAAVDAGGAIRWSWHLWVTDYDPQQSLFSTPANAHGSVWHFMDRNLGALDAWPGSIGAAGLIYQWGRKDPFPGIGSADGAEPARYDGAGEPLPTVPEQAAQFGTLELAAANPHLFYKISYKTNDWTSPSDDDLWGGVSRTKTKWDPCPAGWRVPLADEQGSSPYAFLTEGGATWSASSRGCFYRNWWLPCTGTRVYESGALSADIGGAYGGMWIGTPGRANPDPESYPALYGQYFFLIDSDLLFGTNKDSRSQGMAVRCVRE